MTNESCLSLLLLLASLCIFYSFWLSLEGPTIVSRAFGNPRGSLFKKRQSRLDMAISAESLQLNLASLKRLPISAARFFGQICVDSWCNCFYSEMVVSYTACLAANCLSEQPKRYLHFFLHNQNNNVSHYKCIVKFFRFSELAVFRLNYG